MVYRTVVFYDTMSIALEFYSNIEEWMDPALQKEVLLSFGYGESRILWGWLLPIAAIFVLLAGGFLRNVQGRQSSYSLC